MRAVTIAAAGAAVIGSVAASSHVKHMHAQRHGNVARDTWLDWNSTSTVDPTDVDGASTTKWGGHGSKTTGSTTTTTSKKPSHETTSTTTSKVPSVETTTSGEHTWEDWTSTSTSSKPVDPATTSSSSEVDHTWVDWESSATSSKPVDPATTSSTEEHTWADWESSSTPVDPATTSTVEHTWVDWESSSTGSKPVDPVTEDPSYTWADWVEPTTTITLKSTVTTTKYVEPLTADSSTWADWESSSSESSKVAPVTSIVTSTIVPGWTNSGWFGPAWTVEPGSCAVSIITSYGLPTWNPVADPATTTSSAAHVWEDWTSSSTTSSTPAAVTTTSSTPVAITTTSTTSEHTWEDWTSSTTSSTPVDPTTSSTETWGDWALTASTEVATSTTGGSWGAPGTSATATGGWGVPSSSASSSGVPKPSGGSGSGGYPGITPNGDSWGLTYSPYTAQGGCKDASTVAKDLAIVAAKGFSTVRVYSTDCSTLENVGKSARDNGLKIIIGVWVSSSGFGAAQGQIDDIVAWAQWDLVELIVVGNEVVFNNIASASDLAGFISSSTWAFKSAGYTGPITTTEPLSVWEDSGNAAALGGVVDVIGANLYAFFNAQISADKAGKFIQDQINILKGIFSDKSIYVLESGWPHGGNANGAAVPSPENQAIALKGIQSAVGAQVVFLSYEDEPWKEPGQFGVEQFWGCANVF